MHADVQQRCDFELYMMGNGLGAMVPVTELPGLPFTFKNSAAVFRALDGELGDYIRRELAAREIYAFRRQFENGLHHITWTKPIHTVDDLAGLRIRANSQQMPADYSNMLGATPGQSAFNQLYAALQARTIDGQSDPLIVIDVLRLYEVLYEVQPFLILANHWWSGFTLITS